MDRSNLVFLLELVSQGVISSEKAAVVLENSLVSRVTPFIPTPDTYVELDQTISTDRSSSTKITREDKSGNTGTRIKDWVDTIRNLQIGDNTEFRAQTVRNKRATFNHICKLWGDQNLEDLKPMQITAVLKNIASSNPTKAQRILAELKSIYAEAMANQLVDVNPALHVKNIKYKVKRKRLEFETWKLMARYARRNKEPWVYYMLLLALVTGQRRADLAKLKFSDVNNGYLHIEQQKQAGKGYGARIAIPLDLKLNGLRLSLGDIVSRCKNYEPKGDYLLRSNRGTPLELSSLSIHFRACLRAVLSSDAYAPGESPSLHEVRSLSARQYKKQGIDTQTLLGHKNADMTSLYEDDRGLTAKEYKKVKL